MENNLSFIQTNTPPKINGISFEDQVKNRREALHAAAYAFPSDDGNTSEVVLRVAAEYEDWLNRPFPAYIPWNKDQIAQSDREVIKADRGAFPNTEATTSQEVGTCAVCLRTDIPVSTDGDGVWLVPHVHPGFVDDGQGSKREDFCEGGNLPPGRLAACRVCRAYRAADEDGMVAEHSLPGMDEGMVCSGSGTDPHGDYA